MATLPFAFQFQRQGRTPLDVSDVFDDMPAFQAYLATGPAYAGQIVAVLDGTNVPNIYVINREGTAPSFTYTYSALGGGDVSNVTTGSTTPPSSPDPGALWTTIDGELFIWAGTFWIQVG